MESRKQDFTATFAQVPEPGRFIEVVALQDDRFAARAG
jgi:hypothetical protein